MISPAQLFCSQLFSTFISINLGLSDFFVMIRLRLCIFWQEYHRSDVSFFMHSITMLIYLITSDFKLYHLVELLPDRFLHYFSFCNHKYFGVISVTVLFLFKLSSIYPLVYLACKNCYYDVCLIIFYFLFIDFFNIFIGV